MTDAISVESIKVKQEALLQKFEQALASLQDARDLHVKSKTALIKFNNKYGRVIALMDED